MPPDEWACSMARLFQPLWVLLALIFLVEAWLWDHLEPIVARVAEGTCAERELTALVTAASGQTVWHTKQAVATLLTRLDEAEGKPAISHRSMTAHETDHGRSIRGSAIVDRWCSRGSGGPLSTSLSSSSSGARRSVRSRL